MATTKIQVGSGSGGIGVASVAIKGTITLIQSGIVVDHVAENANAQAYVQEVFAINGLNTIPIPAKAGMLTIVPLADADFPIQFRGTGGAASVVNHTFHQSAPIVISFPATPAANLYFDWGGVKWWEAPVTVNAGTDIVTLAAHGMAANTKIKFLGTTPPDPLVFGTVYYLVVDTAGTFKVALTSGGAAVDITSNGVNVKVSTMCQYRFFWA